MVRSEQGVGFVLDLYERVIEDTFMILYVHAPSTVPSEKVALDPDLWIDLIRRFQAAIFVHPGPGHAAILYRYGTHVFGMAFLSGGGDR